MPVPTMYSVALFLHVYTKWFITALFVATGNRKLPMCPSAGDRVRLRAIDYQLEYQWMLLQWGKKKAISTSPWLMWKDPPIYCDMKSASYKSRYGGYQLYRRALREKIHDSTHISREYKRLKTETSHPSFRWDKLGTWEMGVGGRIFTEYPFCSIQIWNNENVLPIQKIHVMVSWVFCLVWFCI